MLCVWLMYFIYYLMETNVSLSYLEHTITTTGALQEHYTFSTHEVLPIIVLHTGMHLATDSA